MEKVITAAHNAETKSPETSPVQPKPATPAASPAKAAAPKTGKGLTISGSVVCHRGCVRDNNEDNFFFDGDLMPDNTVDEGVVIQTRQTKDFHLFAVCDGMGGLKGGERASSICVNSMGMLNLSMPPQTVPRAIEIYADDACGMVYQDSISIGEEGREGSTLAVLYMTDGKAFVGNVGDSRVYLLRMGKLFQLSADQSPVFRMMQRGELTREQMRKHPQGNVIGAFIGMPAQKKPNPYVNHFNLAICDGDRYMLCSDGLSDLLTHDEMQRRLVDNSDPKTAASLLVLRALELGGKDNTTCMIVDVSGDNLPKASPASLARLPKER